MAYQIVLADTATADANEIYDWVAQRATIRGPEWESQQPDPSLQHPSIFLNVFQVYSPIPSRSMPPESPGQIRLHAPSQSESLA